MTTKLFIYNHGNRPVVIRDVVPTGGGGCVGSLIPTTLNPGQGVELYVHSITSLKIDEYQPMASDS